MVSNVYPSMDAIISFAAEAVFKKVYMVSMISSFSVRSMVSRISSFYGCSNVVLCFSGVFTITHGMVAALMNKSSFFCVLYGINDFFHGCNNFFLCLDGV